MSLSESLIFYAEYWGSPYQDIFRSDSTWNEQGYDHIKSVYGIVCVHNSSECTSTLCLLEAEYQRDLEAS